MADFLGMPKKGETLIDEVNDVNGRLAGVSEILTRCGVDDEDEEVREREIQWSPDQILIVHYLING